MVDHANSSEQQFCLRWNNHQSTLISVFDTLLESGTLVDCTLAAEGKSLKAHKVVLSACSPYFAALLSQQYDKHPIFILKDVKYKELKAMMDYMYRGEVHISQEQLPALLKAAESLQIKGLSDNRNTASSGGSSSSGGGGGGGNSSGGGGGGGVAERTPRPQATPAAATALKAQTPFPLAVPMMAAKTGGEGGNGTPAATDLSMSRESSSSPTSRRKRLRLSRDGIGGSHRTSAMDNHYHHQHHHHQHQQHHDNVAATPPLAPLPIITNTQSLMPNKNAVPLLTKHLEVQVKGFDQEEEGGKGPTTAPATASHTTTPLANATKTPAKENAKDSSTTVATAAAATIAETPLIIDPKHEYSDDDDEGAGEDLTFTDDDDDDDEGMMTDSNQACGPDSQVGEGSSQGAYTGGWSQPDGTPTTRDGATTNTQLDVWSDFMNFGFGSLAEEAAAAAAAKSSKLQRRLGQTFQCVKCGKWYSTKNIMLRHMNHECGVEKNIQCKYCSKMFLRKWNLKQHVKRIHEQPLPMAAHEGDGAGQGSSRASLLKMEPLDLGDVARQGPSRPTLLKMEPLGLGLGLGGDGGPGQGPSRPSLLKMESHAATM